MGGEDWADWIELLNHHEMLAEITPENFKELVDYQGLRQDFLQLNGFDFDNIDY